MRSKITLLTTVLALTALLISCQSQVALPAEQPGEQTLAEPDYVLGLTTPTLDDTTISLRHAAWNANPNATANTTPVTYAVSHDDQRITSDTTTLSVANTPDDVSFEPYTYTFNELNTRDYCGEQLTLTASVNTTQQPPGTPIEQHNNHEQPSIPEASFIADDTTTTQINITCDDPQPRPPEEPPEEQPPEQPPEEDVTPRSLNLTSQTYDEQPQSVRIQLRSPDITANDSFNAVITYDESILQYDSKIDNLISGTIDADAQDGRLTLTSNNADKGGNDIITTLIFDPRSSGTTSLSFTDETTINTVHNDDWLSSGTVTLASVEPTVNVFDVNARSGNTVNIPVHAEAINDPVESLSFSVNTPDGVNFSTATSQTLSDLVVSGDRVSYQGEPVQLDDQFLTLTFNTATTEPYEPRRGEVALEGGIAGISPTFNQGTLSLMNRPDNPSLTVEDADAAQGETVTTSITAETYRCMRSTTLNVDPDDGLTIESYEFNLPTGDQYLSSTRIDDEGNLRAGWTTRPEANPLTLDDGESIMDITFSVNDDGSHDVVFSDTETVGPTSVGGCVLGSGVTPSLNDGVISTSSASAATQR
jgi:hypothetical protein